MADQEDTGWSLSENLPLLIGTAAMGVIVPWIVGFSAQLGFAATLPAEQVALATFAATALACFLAGIAVGWNWRLGALIGGFAIWNALGIILSPEPVAQAAGIAIIAGLYFLGGLVRLPFRRKEAEA